MLVTVHTTLMSRQWQVGKTKCITGPRSPGDKMGIDGEPEKWHWD